MSLINCPQCGKTYSDLAGACPQCGREEQHKKLPIKIARLKPGKNVRGRLIIIILIIVGTVGGLLVFSNYNYSTAETFYNNGDYQIAISFYNKAFLNINSEKQIEECKRQIKIAEEIEDAIQATNRIYGEKINRRITSSDVSYIVYGWKAIPTSTQGIYYVEHGHDRDSDPSNGYRIFAFQVDLRYGSPKIESLSDNEILEFNYKRYIRDKRLLGMRTY